MPSNISQHNLLFFPSFFLIEKAFMLEIPSALYLDKCEADGGLKVYVKATVKENGQRFASYDTIEFQKPDLEIEVNC